MTRPAAVICIALVVLVGIAVAVSAHATPRRSASGGLAWSGYRWNVFTQTGRLGQKWDANHVVVGTSGRLNLYITRDGASGGVGMQTWQTYGTWRARYRFTRGSGKYAILLFGTAAHDEIDWAESRPYDPLRQWVTATLHYGADNQQVHSGPLAGDYTQWHTLEVDWHPGTLRYLIDGRVWSTVTQHVPSAAMHMTLQTSAVGKEFPLGGPVVPADLIIDPVTITR